MPISKLFILILSIVFSIVFPFFLSLIALHKHFLSLRIELHQLKSKVSLLESHIERNNHKLQSKEDDIAEMEKIILEQEESIADLKNEIDSTLPKGSLDTNKGEINVPDSPVIELEKQDFHGWLPHSLALSLNHFQDFILAQWNNSWRPFLDESFQKIWLKMSQALRDAGVCIEMIITERIPILKNQILTFISNLKPHFDFLTAEIIEAYLTSKNILLSHFVKLQTSAIPFMQEWIPILKNQLLTFISNLKPHFDFLTSVTIEAYYGSKSLLSHVVNFQRTATPFMQDLLKYAKPFMYQISTLTKIYLDTAFICLGNLVKKISVFLHDLWKV